MNKAGLQLHEQKAKYTCCHKFCLAAATPWFCLLSCFLAFFLSFFLLTILRYNSKAEEKQGPHIRGKDHVQRGLMGFAF